ncbi:hypothetical protein DNI29_13350 [Hymenobacter sediminis]|uniref:hypothetical protein n=1 Tax=Hymenobacter sediminis TaxID=2218621 RepID=UPI000F51557B|nr:hypothetical protein [Hymenobacter sediminis]RPD47128.1 hypothetical protein DNI29_13350 [Hymenobacter sediminis]
MYAACLIAASILPASTTKEVADSSKVIATPFYVGVQAGAYRYAGLGQLDSNGKPLFYRGLMPVVGAQLSKRSSLEVTAIWRRTANGPITAIDYPDGSKYRYYNRYRSYVIPILYRFSLVTTPRQWDIEAIAGLSILHNRIEGQRSITQAGQPEQSFELGGFSEANDFPITVGAAVTYSPTQRWTVVGETRLNWSLIGSTAKKFFSDDPYLPQLGASVGLRYNFGL